MKLRIYSDIHWEKDRLTKWHPPVMDTDHETILLLAGDLWYGNFSIDVIKEFSHRFYKVIVIFGNHDGWYRDYNSLVEKYRQYSTIVPNLIFLHNESFELDGVIFYGGPLWTDMDRGNPIIESLAKRVMIPDFELPTNFTVGTWKREHKNFIEGLKGLTSAETEKPIVVISHFLPSYESVHEMWRTSASHIMNFFFYSDLDYFMHYSENIKLWVHGHTHNSMDYYIHKTRVYCNPRGYADSIINSEFKHQIIEI